MMAFLCRIIGHDWQRDQSMGYEYEKVKTTPPGEPPLITSSWIGEQCWRCKDTRRNERTYTSPARVQDFVRRVLP